MENIDTEQQARDVRPARNDRELLLSRRFDAPRSQVYACWMDQLHVRQWWGPHGFTVTSFDADERAGGTWRTCMRSPDHPTDDEGEELCASGTFREIVLDEKLVFTWSWESDEKHETLVTITFVDDGVGTRMHFRQGPFATVEDRESHESGWAESFERLAEHIEREHAQRAH
jgi:uncharacterized protein YndB with AHSA1/START domain